jgi:hypothetical protein
VRLRGTEQEYQGCQSHRARPALTHADPPESSVVSSRGPLPAPGRTGAAVSEKESVEE